MSSTGVSPSGYSPQITHPPPADIGSRAVSITGAEPCELEVSRSAVPRLLIVDGDEEIRQTACEVVPSCEFVFDEPVSALENYLRAHPHFEAIVINLRVPTEESFDLIATIKEACPHAEVIFVSRIADETLWIESIQRGAYDLMSAPIDRKEFRRIVTNALERNRPSH